MNVCASRIRFTNDSIKMPMNFIDDILDEIGSIDNTLLEMNIESHVTDKRKITLHTNG